jgi:hypothetical protein
MADLIFEQQQEEKRKSNPAFIEQQKLKKPQKTIEIFNKQLKKQQMKKLLELEKKDAAKSIKDAAIKAADRASAARKQRCCTWYRSSKSISCSIKKQLIEMQQEQGEGGGGDFAGKGSGSGPAGRFSDKRLKENIELIGKSPSNINIYKFNYKNNPTTYQGVMADEVSWASVKHPNGYMMVDYNKIDVEFKKI